MTTRRQAIAISIILSVAMLALAPWQEPGSAVDGAPPVPTAAAVPVPTARTAPGPVVVETLAELPTTGVRVERWAGFRHPVRIEPNVGGEPTYAVADRLLLRPVGGLDPDELARIVRRAGGGELRPVGRGRFVTVALPAADIPGYERVLAALAAEPAIASAEPDRLCRIQGEPNDPGFDQQWALRNTGQTGGTPGADISAVEAWGVTTGDPSVLVAVIDSGIDLDHPDLAPNIWTNPGESGDGKETNGVDDDGNGYVDDVHGWDFVDGDNDPDDTHGHGTHCAGIIGAVGDDGHGVAGVCWRVGLIPLRIMDHDGYGTTADAVAAIEYAAAIGAPLANGSWVAQESSALRDAIATATSGGQLFVAVAGNLGSDIDTHPTYPAAYDLDRLVSVAATDHDDDLAYFSSYGAVGADIGAPGVDVL